MTNPLDQVSVDAIDKCIKGLARVAFTRNDWLSEAESYNASFAGSVVKRHGPLIELFVRRALIISGKYEVWSEPKFWISPLASHSVNIQSIVNLKETRLAYVAASKEMSEGNDENGQWIVVQVDVMAYNKETGKLTALEVKRGKSYNDGPKQRSIVREVMCVQTLLYSYGSQKGYKITDVDARCVFFFGQGRLPKRGQQIIIEPELLDEYFEVPISEFVSIHNNYYESQVKEIKRVVRFK